MIIPTEMDDLVQELDEDVEGMQSTIFFLQQQLREKISNNVANSTSSQSSSEHLVTVNTSELCAQCRAAQEKKQLLKHANCSDPKLIKMEVMEVDNSIDEENARTQLSSNSSDIERTFQNGESDVYSPTCGEQIDCKLADKRTTRANRHPNFSKQSVNLNAESTSPENKNSNSKIGLSPVQTAQCNNAFDGSSNSSSGYNKTKSLADDTETRVSDEDDALDSDIVKPPAAKRTKISSGNNRSVEIGPLQNSSEESRTVVGQLVVATSSRTRNGAVEHS